MKKTLIISSVLIIVLLAITALVSNMFEEQVSELVEKKYTCKTDCPEAREISYSLQIKNEQGEIMPNEEIRVKMIRPELAINNREEFTNTHWIEMVSGFYAKDFDVKRTVTKEQIIEGLRIEEGAKKYNVPEKHNDLAIPISWPKEDQKWKLSEYEEVETHNLNMYAQAINEKKINVDFLQILPEFNQKMQLKLKFDPEQALDFADRYIRHARELFPDSKIIVSNGGALCYDEYAIQSNPSDSSCIHELRNGLWYDQWQFIEGLEKRESPYDIIGYEYHPGTGNSHLFADFEKMFGDLAKYGKPIFIWEFWMPANVALSATDPEFPGTTLETANMPEGGYTQEIQADFYKKTFDYIDTHPEIVGIKQFGWDDRIQDMGKSSGAGLIDVNGKKKKSYFVTEEWFDSLFTECSLKTDENGILKFKGLSGKYRISQSFFSKVLTDLNENNNDQEIILE